MSTPTPRSKIMPGQALDGSPLASDVLSRSLSSFGPPISTLSLNKGTKRKASSMEKVKPPQAASQSFLPIKLEPGSSHRFDYRGSHMKDIHHELCEIPTGHASSSSSDDTDDQVLELHEKEGTSTMGPSRTPRAAGVRLNMSSGDIFALSKDESGIHTASGALINNYGGTHGLLRPLSVVDNSPPTRWQKASGRAKEPRRHSGKRLDDVAYDSIPDYAPPISTLPRGNPHSLRVEWRHKTFADLSNDPDRHMLHEAELKLATCLNLSCAKYLCTKRRIFQARFEVLQAGREFKKSDSQKACKINSNKAGKLCGAFEKVGWFDKKYFLEYLNKSNNPFTTGNNEDDDRGSLSSGLTEPDIWDVSESEFHFTSEEDEESTNDDTADSSVSFDGGHDETGEVKNLDSYRGNSLRKQHYGLSLVGGDGSQRRVLIDETIQTHDTSSGNQTVDEASTIEDRRERRGAVLEEAVFPRNPDGPSGDNNEEVPVLETRSMTQKIELALNSRSEDKSDGVSTIKAKSSQQKLSLKKLHQGAAPTNQFSARNPVDPIPHSLDEANAADIMLVKMKEKGRTWLEIEEAWEKKTGKAQSTRTLSCRYTRIVANIASSGLKPDEVRDSGRSITYPRLEPDDVSDNGSITQPNLSSPNHDQLLLATEAEIEETFQREKADIVAEMESNFESEKWNLVAEAMSRIGSAHHSAESIRAQHERLSMYAKRADPKDAENDDTFTDLPRRTTRAVSARKTETSSPLRHGVGRHDEASNATNLPHPQHPRLLLYQNCLDSKGQATTAIRGQVSAKRSRKCESCGRKYESQAGLIYHREHHPNCELTTPRSYKSKKRKLNSHSNPGHTQPRADGPFAILPAPRVSSPNLTPRQTPTALPHVDRIGNAPALEYADPGPSADGAERGRRKNKSQTHAEQSARARRLWAIRRVLGTDGRRGGPPKASTIANKAKMAISKTTPYGETSLTPTVTKQGGHSTEPLPTQTKTIGIGKEVCRDANQIQQSLEQIIPAASQTDSGPGHDKPFRMVSVSQNHHGVLADRTQHGENRHTCRKCGMNYAHKANHYRVIPKIGSEHTRRMAANNAAAETHLGSAITDVAVESTSDILQGQMNFEISSREQSRELSLSREDRVLPGEVHG